MSERPNTGFLFLVNSLVGYHRELLRILDSKGLATNSYVIQGSSSSELFLVRLFSLGWDWSKWRKEQKWTKGFKEWFKQVEGVRIRGSLAWLQSSQGKNKVATKLDSAADKKRVQLTEHQFNFNWAQLKAYRWKFFGHAVLKIQHDLRCYRRSLLLSEERNKSVFPVSDKKGHYSISGDCC